MPAPVIGPLHVLHVVLFDSHGTPFEKTGAEG